MLRGEHFLAVPVSFQSSCCQTPSEPSQNPPTNFCFWGLVSAKGLALSRSALSQGTCAVYLHCSITSSYQQWCWKNPRPGSCHFTMEGRHTDLLSSSYR